LPLSKQVNEEVTSEFLGENLREEVQVRDEGSLQDDGNVRGVEQLNGIRLLVTLHFAAGNLDLNAEALLSKRLRIECLGKLIVDLVKDIGSAI
jgi:hypothetical protein